MSTDVFIFSLPSWIKSSHLRSWNQQMFGIDQNRCWFIFCWPTARLILTTWETQMVHVHGIQCYFRYNLDECETSVNSRMIRRRNLNERLTSASAPAASSYLNQKFVLEAGSPPPCADAWQPLVLTEHMEMISWTINKAFLLTLCSVRKWCLISARSRDSERAEGRTSSLLVKPLEKKHIRIHRNKSQWLRNIPAYAPRRRSGTEVGELFSVWLFSIFCRFWSNTS